MKNPLTKRTAPMVSARPFLRRLKERDVSQSRFALDHNYTPADITNWKSRGIPRAELPKIARWCGLSIDSYLVEAGSIQPTGQRPLEVMALISDYEALPDGLKEIIARKTSELRQYVDTLPPFMRDMLNKTPTDPSQYRKWEQEIEAALARVNLEESDPAPEHPQRMTLHGNQHTYNHQQQKQHK